MSRNKTTSDYRKDYTPERLEAERAYRAKRYAENRERLLAEKRAARAANVEAALERERNVRLSESPEARAIRLAKKRERYLANRESILAYAEAYRKANAEAILEKSRAVSPSRSGYRKEYRQKNAERQKVQRAAWKEQNADRVKKTNAEWSRNNLDKHRTYQHNRRAKKKANGGTLSPDIAKRLLVAQRGLCPCCKCKLGAKFHIDHIVPIALGGENSDENVQLLCVACNLRKGAKHPVDFMQSQGFLL